jgi:GLPGLI family protein
MKKAKLFVTFAIIACGLPMIPQETSAYKYYCRMRYLLLILFVFSVNLVSAQMESTDGGMSAYRKIVKDEYGKASMLAFYKVSFLKDSTQNDRYTEAQCVLQISDHYLCFSDYYQLKVDSLEDVLYNNKKQSGSSYLQQWNDDASRVIFNTKVVTDLSSQKIRVQVFTGLRDYEYISDQPAINWKLMPGDTLINGMKCKKAIGDYAGRDYVAWYAEEIPCPYGPYIFNGLPGLIMKIQDRKRNWIFTNNGVTQATDKDNIYLYKKGFISGSVKVTTREKTLEALRNEIENNENLFLEVAGVQVLKNGKWITPEQNKPRSPSNLIEQSW